MIDNSQVARHDIRLYRISKGLKLLIEAPPSEPRSLNAITVSSSRTSRIPQLRLDCQLLAHDWSIISG